MYSVDFNGFFTPIRGASKDWLSRRPASFYLFLLEYTEFFQSKRTLRTGSGRTGDVSSSVLRAGIFESRLDDRRREGAFAEYN